jgi:hypothetical protein
LTTQFIPPRSVFRGVHAKIFANSTSGFVVAGKESRNLHLDLENGLVTEWSYANGRKPRRIGAARAIQREVRICFTDGIKDPDEVRDRVQRFLVNATGD